MIRARLLSLAARGFRRFQNPTSFTFRGPSGAPPDTLILAGPNGSGKSSFFEALLFVLGREGLLHQQLEQKHRLPWLRAGFAADSRVVVTLDVVSAPGTLLGTHAPCTVEVVRSLSEWTLRVGAEPLLTSDASVIKQLLAELPVEWFSSWRQPYLIGSVRPMEVLASLEQCEAGRLWRLKKAIIDERARSAFRMEPGRDRAWLDALSASWGYLRGESGESLTVAEDKSDASGSRFDLYAQRFVPEFGNDLLYPVDHMSAGELEWLALAGTLITNAFEGLVLVDEPELHLHPEWQARVLPALRQVAPASQLILATHADPPWDQAYTFQRVLLVPPGDPRAGEGS